MPPGGYEKFQPISSQWRKKTANP